MAETHQKKEFSYPKKEQIIDAIKALDDDIEHVALNLIKCNFDATESDIKKAFPEFSFIKVKNYNPGSFEVVFEMKIDAINFIRNCFDKKILGRRFFIKMGRQHKEVVEDWACIGYVPKKFTQPRKDHRGENKGEHKVHQTKNEDQAEHPKSHDQGQKSKKEQQPKQTKIQSKPQKPVEKVENLTEQSQQQQPEQKKGITIPITYENKKHEDKAHQVRHTNQHNPSHNQQQQQKVEKKVEQTQNQQNTQKTQQQVQQQPQQKTEQKTEQKKEQVKPQVQKQVEQVKKNELAEALQKTSGEDDGWITVPEKKNKNKKR